MGNFYERVAHELAAGIASGRYPVGSRLPTELELCEQFGASRNTVRAALRELSDLGLISRRKKAGTRVESAQPTGTYRHSFDSVDALVQFGATHKRAVREIADVVTDRALAQKLGCPAGKPWRRISSVRMDESAGGTPVGWTDVYVDPAFSEVAELARANPETLVSSLIESRFGRSIAAIRQEIRGVLIPAALAPVLETKAGAPGLEVIRRYEDSAGENVETSVSVHPADRFTVTMRLTREKG
jgi:DNA-binding GntR family transcriptional regulator